MASPGERVRALVEAGVPQGVAVRRVQAEEERSREAPVRAAEAVNEAGRAAATGVSYADVPADLLRAWSHDPGSVEGGRFVPGGNDIPGELGEVMGRAVEGVAAGEAYDSPYEAGPLQRAVSEAFIPGLGGPYLVASGARLARKTPSVLSDMGTMAENTVGAVRNVASRARGGRDVQPYRPLRAPVDADAWDPPWFGSRSSPGGGSRAGGRMGFIDPSMSDEEAQAVARMVLSEGDELVSSGGRVVPGEALDRAAREASRGVMGSQTADEGRRFLGLMTDFRGLAKEGPVTRGQVREVAARHGFSLDDLDELGLGREFTTGEADALEGLRARQAGSVEPGSPEFPGERASFEAARAARRASEPAVERFDMLGRWLREAPDSLAGRHGRVVQKLDDRVGITGDLERMREVQEVGGDAWVGHANSRFGPVEFTADVARTGADEATSGIRVGRLPWTQQARRQADRDPDSAREFIQETLGSFTDAARDEGLPVRVASPPEELQGALRSFGFRKRPNMDEWMWRPQAGGRSSGGSGGGR